MKKLSYVLVFFALIFSCSDEFTESPAVGALSDTQLANSEGVDLLLTGAYSALDGVRQNLGTEAWAASATNWWIDCLTDDAHKGSEDGDQGDLFNLEIYDWQTSNQYFLGKWKALYAGVNRANQVISVINNITDEDLSAKMGEARLLRAHYYFELQRNFGNVAYINEENLVNLEFNQPNSGPVWAEIEADLEYAVANLPASQPQAGRVNSWVAKAYLGKVYLYQGKYAEALTPLQDVIDFGPYSLLTDYVDNFRLAGENASESIFSIQFVADASGSFNGNQNDAIAFPIGIFNCCGFYAPSQDLANAYQTENGLPLLDTYAQTDIANDYGLSSADDFTPHSGPLDPRIDYTIGRRGIDYNGFGPMPGADWVRDANVNIATLYIPKKSTYWSGEDSQRGAGAWGQQQSGIDYHIIRLADVMLMAAEAAAETGDLATAVLYVDQIRERAKNSNYVANEAGDAPAANYEIELYGSFADQAEAIKAIRFERRLELAMEGHRMFDLRRWGVDKTVIDEYIVNEGADIPKFGSLVNPYQSHYSLFPIPLGAIDESGNALEQNTGY